MGRWGTLGYNFAEQRFEGEEWPAELGECRCACFEPGVLDDGWHHTLVLPGRGTWEPLPPLPALLLPLVPGTSPRASS